MIDREGGRSRRADTRDTPTLYTDPEAVARRNELMRLTKERLVDMARKPVRPRVGDGISVMEYGKPELWRKDDLVMNIVSREYPHLPYPAGEGRQ